MKKTSWRIAWIIVLMTGIACNLGLAGKAVPAQRTSTTSESSVMTTAPSSTSNSGAPSVQSNPDTVCDGTGCISLKKFSENIDSELQGKVVGYVSMIGSTPIISTYGQARTAANPPATAMGTSIPSNIASLSKVLTTVSVLQWLASHNLTVYAKISSYLPPDWTQGPNIDTITFKDLLTYRAGFRNDENNEFARRPAAADRRWSSTERYGNTTIQQPQLRSLPNTSAIHGRVQRSGSSAASNGNGQLLC